MLRTHWDEVRARVRATEDRALCEPWLDCLRFVDGSGSSLVLAAPNRLYVEWILDNLDAVLVRHLREVLGRDCTIRYELDPSIEPTAASVADEPVLDSADAESSRLNPRQTFDTFVVGHSNQFAFAACRNVATQPARNYNPLFLFSGVGLGKTHLLQAIGNRIRELFPSQRVLYMSAEDFTNELIAAIGRRRTEDFRKKFRESCDVLLVDDIQVLATRERTQEEFVHTFNALHQAGKQIVVTGDRYPREIEGLEDRLRSRFDWGLIADIQPPDVETKVAILCRCAHAEQRTLPQDVAFFLARHCQGNVRELEGVLCRVLAMSGFHGAPLTVDFARSCLMPLLPSAPPVHEVDRIVDVVARHYRVKTADLMGNRRQKHVVEPRQLAMYFARQHTALSYPELGRRFDRDHTTVLYAVDRVSQRRQADPGYELEIQRIDKVIRDHRSS